MADDNNKTVICGKCKVVLEESSDIQPDHRLPCPTCGSLSRITRITASDSATIKEKVRMKGKHQGGKEPFIKQISGDDLFRKTGKWMRLSRVIDVDNDSYSEVITDPVTGEIVHKCEEPLSKHTGHGSAKHEKNSPGRSAP